MAFGGSLGFSGKGIEGMSSVPENKQMHAPQQWVVNWFGNVKIASKLYNHLAKSAMGALEWWANDVLTPSILYNNGGW